MPSRKSNGSTPPLKAFDPENIENLFVIHARMMTRNASSLLIFADTALMIFANLEMFDY